ncbi:hypothetical protein [Neptunomonas sp.]|uniref:hypothetical protein n=1 Tax=Neptunomonas sp. TaxID=1971898 RepID=UPI0035624023
MARMARVVIPNYPHHITQRGNRRQETFFIDDDYQAYISLLSNAKKQAGIDSRPSGGGSRTQSGLN